jgi:hypothetical protein
LSLKIDNPEIEALAALSHEQWSGWMRQVVAQCEHLSGGNLLIPSKYVERWARQVNTPYADLTEAEQNYDRKEAHRILALLQKKSP